MMMGYGWGSYGHSGYGLLAMGGMGLFWVLVVGVIIWAIVYMSRGHRPSSEKSYSQQILRERYARGEIDEEEFERRMSRL